MKKKITETTESTYNNHPIMTDKEDGLSCNTMILHEIERQFEHAEETKSKIFFMRYDIRFPLNYELSNNDLFRTFQSALMKNLSRRGLEPQYVAVREQSRERHQHYHVALFLDGQKTKNICDHIKTAERLWDRTLGLPERDNGYGLIDDCTLSRDGKPQVNGVLLRRDDPNYAAQKDDCFRRASYLAKTNTKGKAPKGQREVFSSRIPKSHTPQ